MRKHRPFRFDAVDPTKCTVEMRMRWMRVLAQAVDDPRVDAFQMIERTFRQFRDVR